MGGRGSKGGSNPMTERERRINEIRNQEYQYHATTGDAVFSIASFGLRPNRGHMGEGVYFAPSEKGALEWTEFSSTGGTTVLRVKTKTLRDNYEWGMIDDLESTADKAIRAKDIEIHTSKGWMSLESYVESPNQRLNYNEWRRKNSFYKPRRR